MLANEESPARCALLRRPLHVTPLSIAKQPKCSPRPPPRTNFFKICLTTRAFRLLRGQRSLGRSIRFELQGFDMASPARRMRDGQVDVRSSHGTERFLLRCSQGHHELSPLTAPRVTASQGTY
eukprot:6191067-Pleurochrysis_carterae.AAC.1